MGVTTSTDLGNISEYEINVGARAKSGATLWVKVVTLKGKASSGFIRVLMDSGCWCLDTTEQIGKYWYGLADTDLANILNQISDKTITTNYKAVIGTLSKYLHLIDSTLKQHYFTVEIEIVSLSK